MASGSNKEPEVGSGDEAPSSGGTPGVEVEPVPQGAQPGDDEPAAAAPPTTPYYECVFCKRGFTTAQALGGHMNIHRRDRAKPSGRAGTTTTSASRNAECYNQYPNHHLPYPALIPATSTPVGTSGSFTLAYYQHKDTAGASAGAVDAEASVNPSSAGPRELSLFGAAARDLDLHGGGGSGGTPEGLDQQAGEPPEKELDLELRLGRRPRH